MVGARATSSDYTERVAVTDEQIVEFLRTHIRSVWALELLLLFARDASRAWQPDDLVRAMHSSRVVVSEALRDLQRAGLLASDADQRHRSSPSSRQLDALVTGIQPASAI